MTPEGTSNPEMGSGHFPDNDLIHHCYFRLVSYRNKLLSDVKPGMDMVENSTDVPKCYGLNIYDSQATDTFGFNVHIGGPGPGGAC